MPVLKIVSFNLRYDNPNDGAWAWPKRSNGVAEYLRQSQPDIIGFQEVLPHQRQQLEAMLGPDYGGYGVGRDCDLGGEQCPIFWRRNRFELLAQSVYWLSSTPSEPGSRIWQGLNDHDQGPPWLPRLASVVRLRFQGLEFEVVNTHYDYEVEAARLRSSQLILERRSSIPTLVMGDFNAQVDDPSLRHLEAVWTNPVRAVSHLLSTPTWHDFRGESFQEGQHIDFFFISSEFEVRDYRLVTQPIWSDHFPVELDLDLNPGIPVVAGNKE